MSFVGLRWSWLGDLEGRGGPGAAGHRRLEFARDDVGVRRHSGCVGRAALPFIGNEREDKHKEGDSRGISLLRL